MAYDIPDAQRAKLIIRHQYDLVSRAPLEAAVLRLRMSNLVGADFLLPVPKNALLFSPRRPATCSITPALLSRTS